jgi:cyclase
MKRFIPLLLLCLAAGWSPSAAQSGDFDKVEIKTTKIAGSIWMLEGAGGNIGVSAGPDGLLIVDDQFAPLADKIKAALKQINPGKLAFLVNTHFHGDHTGGNPVFGKEATIIAQDNVRARLSAKQVVRGQTRDPMAKEGWPIITFADGLTVWFNGEPVEVVHVPHGHTDGDSIIFFKGSNVVHMGDQFFNGTFPYIDVDSGGSVDGYVKNVAAMIEKIPAGAKIIPGHGPLGTIDDLKRFQAMLVTTTGIVREEIAQGMTLDQAEKTGLPDEWKTWATEFVSVERWVEMIYTGTKKP